MKQLILNIEENKFNAFLTFIRTLEYVSVSVEGDIPDWQQDEVTKRTLLIEKGEMKTRNWEEDKGEIFKK